MRLSMILGEKREHVALIFGEVYCFPELNLAILSNFQTSVMSGGNVICPDLICFLQDCAPLDLSIAKYTGAGRQPVLIGVNKR